MKANTLTTFTDLGLCKQVLKAVSAQGYDTPTPIQAQAIPHLMNGCDILGVAQTGTGKTAAFALPTLDHIANNPEQRRARRPRALVLAPTRELAIQIADNFKTYSRYMDCSVQSVFGGIKIGRQIQALSKGCDVLVATPGRLLDLMDQKAVILEDIEILIMDEADQMFDLGFLPAINKIMAKVPEDRQTLLFSATMPKAIAQLAQRYLYKPEKVSVAPQSTTAERVKQGVFHVSVGNKPALLSGVLKNPKIERALVFTRTKHGADKLVRKLMGEGRRAVAIHGNKSQSQRIKALDAFKTGQTKVLIATDIAARGIDISSVSHVINYDLPSVAEQYVHRIGRTARAGREGLAVSFVSSEDLAYLRDIEKITGQEIEVTTPPEGCEGIIAPTPDRNVRPKRPAGPKRGGGGKPRNTNSKTRTKPPRKPTTRPKRKPKTYA